MADLARDYNHSRYQPGSAGGFYESYFQRANHPTRPLAFWIRYTVFSPKGRPQDAIGELWAVWFDGEAGRHVVAKSEVPAGQVTFSRDGLNACIGTATLVPGQLRGSAASRGHRIDWDLAFSGQGAPLFLFAPELYAKALPKAKSLVGLPLARYRGTITVDGQAIAIDDWVGSQNHNWGAKHTDRYAWGQVAGFDNAPDSFLEVATGQIKVGPFWTPRLTPLVLRHGGEEFALRTIGQALRASGSFVARPSGLKPALSSPRSGRIEGPLPQGTEGHFHWHFSSRAAGIEIEGRISAPKEAFVGLRYYNPPGGEKWCLNSKLASCRLVLKRPGRPAETLETRHRAAFEILTDDTSHGIEIRT
jgi:hypothetical protein